MEKDREREGERERIGVEPCTKEVRLNDLKSLDTEDYIRMIKDEYGEICICGSELSPAQIEFIESIRGKNNK